MLDPSAAIWLAWALVALAGAWAYVCHKLSKVDMAIMGFVAIAGLVLAVPAVVGADYGDRFMLLSASGRKSINGVTIACFAWAAMLLMRHVSAAFLGAAAGAIVLVGLRLADAPAWLGVAVWGLLCLCLYAASHRRERSTA